MHPVGRQPQHRARRKLRGEGKKGRRKGRRFEKLGFSFYFLLGGRVADSCQSPGLKGRRERSAFIFSIGGFSLKPPILNRRKGERGKGRKEKKIFYLFSSLPSKGEEERRRKCPPFKGNKSRLPAFLRGKKEEGKKGELARRG